MNDKIKEKIAHLRQWLFIFLLIISSIAGWLFVNDNEILNIRGYLAFFGIVFFSMIAIIIEVKIIKNIKNIKNGNNNN